MNQQLPRLKEFAFCNETPVPNHGDAPCNREPLFVFLSKRLMARLTIEYTPKAREDDYVPLSDIGNKALVSMKGLKELNFRVKRSPGFDVLDVSAFQRDINEGWLPPSTWPNIVKLQLDINLPIIDVEHFLLACPSLTEFAYSPDQVDDEFDPLMMLNMIGKHCPSLSKLTFTSLKYMEDLDTELYSGERYQWPSKLTNVYMNCMHLDDKTLHFMTTVLRNSPITRFKPCEFNDDPSEFTTAILLRLPHLTRAWFGTESLYDSFDLGEVLLPDGSRGSVIKRHVNDCRNVETDIYSISKYDQELRQDIPGLNVREYCLEAMHSKMDPKQQAMLNEWDAGNYL